MTNATVKENPNAEKSLRYTMLALLGIAAVGCLDAVAAPKGAFERLAYNRTGTCDLKGGLFSWPMMIDVNGDGRLDVVLTTSCVTPLKGQWWFENTGRLENGMPVFKAARPLNKGGDSGQVLPDGRVAVFAPGKVAYDWRENGMKNAHAFAGLPANVHSNAVRGNVWRFADLDGDGRLDLTVGVGDWKDYGWHNSWDAAGEWTRGPLRGPIYYIRNETGADGAERWAKPRPLCLANGKPIDIYAYAAPLFADWDGDGDLDLLSPDFVDAYTYFENIGTPTAPKFATGRPILDKFLRPITADLCMVTATVADVDGDGHPDFITCEEDAVVRVVRNTGRIAMGMPVFEQARALRQECDCVATGILATPAVCDFDGDGDEDIVAGNSAGYVVFIENLSGPRVAKPSWAEPVNLEADGAPIRIIAGPNGSIQGPCERKWGYTCLSVADWDGDGRLDVMLNSIRGEIHWCRNLGGAGGARRPANVCGAGGARRPANVGGAGGARRPANVDDAGGARRPANVGGAGGARRPANVCDAPRVAVPRLAPPEPVAAEWEGPQPELGWGWMKPNGSKNILTQWRTTPCMIDLDEDGLMDLVMLDVEGYLCLWRRARRGGRLVVLPPERVLCDEKGKPLLLAGRDTKAGPKSNFAGGSGRRKFCFVDWTGDGRKDLVCNSKSVMLCEFVGRKDGKWLYRTRGDLSDECLAGHTTNPSPCDFDGDGKGDLLVGAEDGFFYFLPRK